MGINFSLTTTTITVFDLERKLTTVSPNYITFSMPKTSAITVQDYKLELWSPSRAYRPQGAQDTRWIKDKELDLLFYAYSLSSSHFFYSMCLIIYSIYS